MVKFPNISPNLLLGVGGVIAAVFLVNEIRKAGGDLQNALSGLQLPPIDISLPEIKFPELKLPEIKLPDLFPPTEPTPSILAGEIVKPFPFSDTTITIPETTTVLPSGVVVSETPPLLTLSDVERQAALIAREEALRQRELDIIRQQKEAALSQIPVSEDISGAEFTAAINEAEFQKRLLESQVPIIQPEIISELPTEQVFGSGGVSFIGGTIRENPIDTLSEAIDLGLTASQAADFLAATGGVVTPSQIESGIVDPDIRNIVAGFIGGGEGQAFPVSSTPLETLSIREAENIKAAEFTCREFGLNCELVDGMMA